jgi:Ca-activated chloride channel family protein
MEKLADKGNGNYAYIDSQLEARKVLVEQMGATLETIAKDVKIQVEFNPLAVEGYRLIGYENRLLAAQDFADDTKDAGEIGAGHTVTALYEVVPAGAGLEVPGLDPLRYQSPGQPSGAAFGGELLFVRLRYKQPEGDESTLLEIPVADEGGSFFEASEDLRFAVSTAAFGMVLRGSAHVGDTTLAEVLDWAVESAGDDPGGYRVGFLELVRAANGLKAN